MSPRLHPLSVPYRAAETVVRLGWPLVFVMVGSVSITGRIGLVVVLVVGGLALALLHEGARYHRFAYDLADDVLDIRSGVVSHRRREIPYTRIQNVDLSRNPVQRALGLTAVAVETAGGGETEVTLRFVRADEARRIQSTLGERRRGDAPGDGQPERELFSLTRRELGLLGLVSLDFRFVSVMIVILSLAAPSMAERLRPSVGGAVVLAAPALLVVVYLLAALLGGSRAVASYHGFKLRRSGGELRYERGLMARFSGTIPLDRVQTATVRANVLARTLGYASLVVETAGYAPGDADRATVVPIADRDRVLSLARSIEPFGSVDVERPPTRARTRYIVRYLLVGTVLVAVAYGIDRVTAFPVGWWVLLAVLPVAPVLGHLQWRHRGYALQDDHFLARNGFWVETVTVVPFDRVQTVFNAATLFQRRRNLATVTVDTAGSRSITGRQPAAVDIDRDVAADLLERVVAALHEHVASR